MAFCYNFISNLEYAFGEPTPKIQLTLAIIITSSLDIRDEVDLILNLSISSFIEASYSMYVSDTGK